MKLTKLFFAAVILLSANTAFAQDKSEATHLVNIKISEVALLDLEVATGTTEISLAGTAPTEAGLPMTFEDATAKNATIWMNYSSIVKGKSRRNVSVAITDGVVPNGLKLTALASAYSGNGKGNLGKVSGKVIILDKNAQEIVAEIGSAFTGDKAKNGHLLTYQLDYATDAATDYKDLDFDNSGTLKITYTLSDI